MDNGRGKDRVDGLAEQAAIHKHGAGRGRDAPPPPGSAMTALF